MPLVKEGQIAVDEWTRVDPEADEMPSGTHLLVSFEQWMANKVELCKRGGVFGLQLRSDQSPELIEKDLIHFGLVALEFPAFTDGRAYSYARLLRERYGFEGEVRAVGDVLMEQLVFMQRSGINAFEYTGDTPDEDWAAAFADVDVWYQPTVDGRPTAIQLRHRRT